MEIMFKSSMRLLTLEGLPKVCEDVLTVLHANKVCAIIPSPMIPLSTSLQVTPADIMTTSLSNLLTRLKTLQRMHSIPTDTTLFGGCHWIESAPIPLKERAIFHRLMLQLTMCIIDDFQIPIEQHIIVLMSSPVDECFDRLLTSMEARDYTLHDLAEEAMFLDMVTHIPGAASAFPYRVHRVPCTPYMHDNQHDKNVVAARIASILL